MGYSERTDAPPVRRSVSTTSDDVIDALDIDGPIVIAAHDWGGPISLGMGRAPHATASPAMVLCNTGVAVPAGRQAPTLIRFAASGPITDLRLPSHPRRSSTARIALSRARLAVEAARRRCARRTAAPTTAAAIADFVDDVPFAPPHPSAARDRRGRRTASVDCTMPVLLAWGATDPVFDDDFAHDLAGRLPHADQHRFAARRSPRRRSRPTSPAWSTTGSADRVVARPVTVRRHDAASDAADVARAVGRHSTLARDDDDARSSTVRPASATSFAELHRRVDGHRRRAGEHGRAPGDRVAVLVPPERRSARHRLRLLASRRGHGDRRSRTRAARPRPRGARPRTSTG